MRVNGNTVYQQVGNAVAEWETDSPLLWAMKVRLGKSQNRQIKEVELDLRTLTSGYELTFLLALKDALIEDGHRLDLLSLSCQCQNLRRLLLKVQTKDLGAKVSQIDSGFIVALNALRDEIPATYLSSLRQLHKVHREDFRLFDATVRTADFATRRSKRGAKGDQIHRILSSALRRATMVQILDTVEDAFEQDWIDIGHYSFIRLALHIFCRPESYRQLTLSDLRVDKHPQTGAVSYFLDVLPAKSRVRNPRKIVYHLHREVGRLLAMQRESVVKTYGHLVAELDIGKLALFPARGLRSDGTWISGGANDHSGMLDSGGKFSVTYLKPIRKLTQLKFSFVGLRHTIGTQLAQLGCSAQTIQAVLKHATDQTCLGYVDIVFDGLIDELSDSLESGFEERFPVFKMFASKFDPIPPERRIESEDLKTGTIETTAMCGRQVACHYAPIACYACGRFIPCYDADHSINLDATDREIQLAEGGGLAMQHEIKRWKTIRNHIRLTMTACEIKRQAIAQAAAESAA